MHTQQVCTLYWPGSATGSESGWVVGWNIGGFVAVVTCVVPATSTSYTALSSRLARGDPEWPPSLDVIGRWHAEPDVAWDSGQGCLSLESIQATANFWIELESLALHSPVALHQIYCCGYRYTRLAMHVVVFDPPRDAHYLSIAPLSLDVASLPPIILTAGRTNHTPHAPATIADDSPQTEGGGTFQPPMSGTPATNAPPIAAGPRYDAGPGVPDTGVILDHVNVADRVRGWIMGEGRGGDTHGDTNGDTGGVTGGDTDRDREGAGMGWRVVAFVWAWMVFPWLLGVRVLAGPVIRVLNAPFPWYVQVLVQPHVAASRRKAASLVVVSSVAKLVDERLYQLCMLPVHAEAMLQHRSRGPGVRAHYIHGLNTVWLLVNDLVMGLLALFFVRNQAEWAIQLVHRSALLLTGGDILSSHLMWLMGWPSGFKLNAAFDAFLGANFMRGIEAWRSFTDFCSPANIYFFYAVLASSTLGLSMMLAVCSDLLSIITFHVYVFYRVAAVLYKSVADVMSSLWKLFRGKKYNVLRKRIDSCNYNLDQLLLGTILFTIFFFLAPTVIVYYVFFTLARLAIVSAQLFLLVAVSLLHHFPLAPLTLAWVDPSLLPGGIRFQPISGASLRRYLPAYKRNLWAQSPSVGDSGSAAKSGWATYFQLCTRPLPIGAFFFQFARIAEIVSATQPLSLRPMLSGQPIRPPPDLSYPHTQAIPGRAVFVQFGRTIRSYLAED